MDQIHRLNVRCHIPKFLLGRAGLLLGLVAGLMLVVPPSSGRDSFVTREELIATFSTRNIDRVLEMLNNVKRMQYKDDILPTVHSLWLGDWQADQSVVGKVAAKPVVRVELANILLQADRNGIFNADRIQIGEFLRATLKDANGLTLANAVLTLGLLNNPQDVPQIHAIAERQESYSFGAAAIALSRMCNSAAGPALDELEEMTKGGQGWDFLGGQSPHEYIRETRRELAAFRDFNPGIDGTCSY